MTPTTLTPARKPAIVYPESDGKPMADNTKQWDWITKIKGNLSILYRDDPNVFVAGDLLWYPVEGFPEIRAAPDVLVAFGRPKGDRGSYLQWQEDDAAPQVVFEILSPSNDYVEMQEKFDWYEEHGVEEYYVFDPDKPDKLFVFLRDGAILRPKRPPHGFVSPRMKIRFDLSGKELAIFHPDGRPFLPIEQIDAQRAQADKRATRLAELSLKLLAGTATDEDKQELARLAAPPAF